MFQTCSENRNDRRPLQHIPQHTRNRVIAIFSDDCWLKSYEKRSFSRHPSCRFSIKPFSRRNLLVCVHTKSSMRNGTTFQWNEFCTYRDYLRFRSKPQVIITSGPPTKRLLCFPKMRISWFSRVRTQDGLSSSTHISHVDDNTRVRILFTGSIISGNDGLIQ